MCVVYLLRRAVHWVSLRQWVQHPLQCVAIEAELGLWLLKHVVRALAAGLRLELIPGGPWTPLLPFRHQAAVDAFRLLLPRGIQLPSLLGPDKKKVQTHKWFNIYIFNNVAIKLAIFWITNFDLILTSVSYSTDRKKGFNWRCKLICY